MNLTKHFPPEGHGEFKGFYLPIFANREGSYFLYSRSRTPTGQVIFINGAARTSISNSADSQDSGSIARITIKDPPAPGLGGYLRKFFVKLVTELTGLFLRLSFTPAFPIAEEFGVGFPIFVTSHKPSMS